MKPKIVLLLLIISSVAYNASAHTNKPGTRCCKKNEIAGGVLQAENKKPLSKVFITAYYNSKKEKVTLTDVNGNYDLNDLKPGVYKLVFEKDGFQKIIRDKVTIKQDEGFQLNIEMEETTGDFQILPGVVVFPDIN